MKKLTCLIMAAVTVFACFSVSASAKESARILELAEKFEDGIGPEVNGIKIDYVSYTPENLRRGVKYPLVILIHGMGQGGEKREQIVNNDFPAFAGREMQSRFTNGAAYIFIPRSDESENPYGTWSDDEVEPLYAAIRQFISANRAHIDTTRIYIGGYSMGGKMVLKMISSYPKMFAAAFPMCPAYIPTDAQIEAVKNMPLWVLSSRYDVIGGYHVFGKQLWEQICRITKVPGKCRLSVFGTVCYPDGKKTPSNHHVWFAASNDMFSYKHGDYPNMTTCDANGKEIKLTYPDGLISWLCKYRSSYSGADLKITNLVEENDSKVIDLGIRILKGLKYEVADTFRAVVKTLTGKLEFRPDAGRPGIFG
ncbi:MAG: prolyl oligopeptidase family serine peptidase [Clostridia bacterium]|nr:prolyl oligopeptidase family serine peptidase [Clostridia bacterium]